MASERDINSPDSKDIARLLRRIAELEAQNRSLEARVDVAPGDERRPDPSPSDTVGVQNETLLRSIADNLPVLISFIDVQGRYRFVNAEYEKWYQLKREEITGRTVRELIGEEAYKKAESGIKRALRGESSEHESEIVLPGGKKSCLTRQIPLSSESGEVLGITALVEDITERKEAERTIQASEKRFRESMDFAAVGIAQSDPDGRIIYANDALCTMLGYSKEALLGKTFSEITHPEDQERDREEFTKIVTGQRKTIRFEKRYLKKDGSVLWVNLSASAVRNEAGETLYFTGVVENITRRRKAETTIREQNRFLNTVLESLPFPFFVIDVKDRRIRMANRAGGGEQVIGSFCHGVFHHSDHPCSDDNHECPMDDMLREPRDIIIEHLHYDKDGREKYFEVHGFPVLNDQGELIQMIEISRDITTRKRAEDALLDMNEELERRIERRTAQLKETQRELIQKEKLATVGRLAGTVSHDLRTPLGVIGNSTYYLKARLGDGDEKISRHLNIIETELQKTVAILSDILDFTTGMEIQTEPTDVNELLAGVIEAFPLRQGILLHSDLHPEKLPASLDVRKMERAIRNLITNAVQAMPEGGVISVSITADHHVAEIRFHDTGPGIEPENLERIFEPFFTTKHKGIGLGLPNVREIIEKHGGSVEAKNDPEGGALFIVRLPLLQGDPRTPGEG